MIQPNELRIGNVIYEMQLDYYLDENSKPSIYIVNKHSFTEIDGSDLYHPIPLTEEILLKCGFGRFEDTEIRYKLIDCELFEIIVSASGTNLLLQVNGKTIKSGTFGLYLHQLQNLYFALTGKELEIKI